MLSVFKNTWLRARKTMLFWCIALVLWALTELSLFKSIMSEGGMAQMFEGAMQNMPEVLKQMFFTMDITTPVGYFNARLLSLTLPLVMVIHGISLGNAAVAGEEQHGQLDLLLSNPISRTRYYLGRWLAMVTMQLLLVGVFYLTCVGMAPMMGIPFEGAHLLDALVSVFLLGLTASSLALMAGSLFPHAGVVMGVSSVVLLLSYLLNAAAPLNADLKDLQKLSVFYYYNEYLPIKNGLEASKALVLLGAALVLGVVGLIRFNTRDLSK
ncbi:ABC transporter permease [Deinococcus misasensis]|uniref:ABC transporter permease n=1 Tax=Deinococcus misasensis TaxID=392413 RepID=UPI000552A789|nr:ABC transporter permease subunit [Deinococcus misasensis]